MPIYRVEKDKIVPLERTAFDRHGLKERQNLQKMLKLQIDVISPDTLVVAEEFGDWDDSRRRIDLLGIDKEANLVVIELKRTEDGGHMELQGVRYAAMISTLTFEKLIEIYTGYITDNDLNIDAEDSLLSFLGWNEANEDEFGQEVKIVLASAEFSKEITTSVMWLNEFGLDIRCVRLHPYVDNGEILMDVQTVIPIPEVADYQVRIREKKQKEREARTGSKDLTKFDLSICDQFYKSCNKRWMMFNIISNAIKHGISPEQIIDAVPERKKVLFHIFDGILDQHEIYRRLTTGSEANDKRRPKRFFISDGEFFHVNNKTYILSNQWGKGTIPATESISKMFPELKIKYNSK